MGWERYRRGGGGGGASVTVKQVTKIGDFPQLATITPWRITEADTNEAPCIPLINEDGKLAVLTGEETALFNMRLVGSDTSVIDDAECEPLTQDADGRWCATFFFSEENPIPEAGDYEITVQVGGRTYPRGGRQQVRVLGAI